MTFIQKIILFIKNILKKPDKIKKIAEPKVFVDEKNTEDFITSLKIDIDNNCNTANTNNTVNIESTEGSKVKTLICEGDGLGIQTKITC